MNMLSIFVFLFRLMQRIYFLLRGHIHSWQNSPRKEVEDFVLQIGVKDSKHTFKCRDGTNLNYRRIGDGKRIVYLANGVGTNFFMWLPVLRAAYSLYPTLFKEITLIAPSYRGLFATDSDQGDVHITMQHCVEDTMEVLVHAKISKCHAIIGWSMGAQMAITLCSKYESITERLFLLNPSTGLTLQYLCQPVVPLPLAMRQSLSYVIRSALAATKHLCKTSAWDFIKVAACSTPFKMCLVICAFLGGSPPEQPSYFFEYVVDLFATRKSTTVLLDLVMSLDAAVPDSALSLNHRTIIVSSCIDVMTAAYHSTKLTKGMSAAKHVMFSMGSHFLLIEWPVEVAKLILELIMDD